MKHSEWKALWRLSNPSKGREYRQSLREFKAAFKNKPCADCGLQFSSIAMEFDHQAGFAKINKVSYPLGRRASIAEIAKCEVVCVLCHRLRSYATYSQLFSKSKTALAKRALAQKIDKIKNAPCAKCAKIYHPCQMDFDHIEPQLKIDKISNLVRRRAAWSIIEAEIAKCQLLCALCHRLKDES